MARDIFKKIAAASANQKGDYLTGGRGVVVVLENLFNPNAQGAPAWVTRVKVVSSESKGQVDDAGKPLPINAPGSRAGWVQSMKHQSALGNIKSYFLNATGFKESEVTADEFAETMEQAIDKAQPMRGMLIGYDTYQQGTRAAPNKKNCYITWLGIKDGNDRASIAARRAELDKTDPITA